MKRPSHAAALAASLFFGSAVAAVAADDSYDDMPFETAGTSEERLLGSDDDAARFLALQPFTRDIAAAGVVSDALAQALAEAHVPATVLLEARQALAGTIDLGREVGVGDRFHVRYRQPFTAEGTPIGTARLLWLELRTTGKGTIALHRFRPSGGTEQLWLANGEAAGTAPLRLPLDILNVSSGFGLRPDPLDKPGPAMGPLADAAPVAAAPAPEAPPAPTPRQPPPPPSSSWLMMGNGTAFGSNPGFAFSRDLLESRPSRRRAEPKPLPEAAPPPEPVAEAPAPPPSPPPPPAKPRLFMHDGLDLVAVTGTSIYAAADGIVTGAGPNGGYGNWMQIDHAGKLTTVYGHLSAFAPGIEAGAQVSQGELIGFVGNTGRSTGAHLHFEIVVNGRTVNPLAFPGIKRQQLAGADLDRFKKQVKRSLEERDRETKVEALISELRN